MGKLSECNINAVAEFKSCVEECSGLRRTLLNLTHAADLQIKPAELSRKEKEDMYFLQLLLEELDIRE